LLHHAALARSALRSVADAGQFPLQNSGAFGTVTIMRRAAVVISLCLAGSALAQEQESKLVDRLLKPNMTLSNSAQNKSFVGTRETTAKAVTTREFVDVRQNETKNFGGQRAFFAWLFGSTRDFPHRTAAATLATRSDVPQKTFAARESPAIRELPDAEKSAATSDYAGNRPFLARGKSQKSLDAQHHQMSIDEVRELLNRNK
jgi:endonuclease/exonuclease/phosphatase (EEP) superfamily protein YafD